MQFVVTGMDGDDANALERRLAAREDHLRMAREMYDSGRWLYAVALLTEEGTMKGSVIVCDFPSREALEKDWLSREPYVLGKVWEHIEIQRAQVPPFCSR